MRNLAAAAVASLVLLTLTAHGAPRRVVSGPFAGNYAVTVVAISYDQSTKPNAGPFDDVKRTETLVGTGVATDSSPGFEGDVTLTVTVHPKTGGNDEVVDFTGYRTGKSVVLFHDGGEDESNQISLRLTIPKTGLATAFTGPGITSGDGSNGTFKITGKRTAN